MSVVDTHMGAHGWEFTGAEGAPAGGESSGGDDDVIDADFTVKDDDNK